MLQGMFLLRGSDSEPRKRKSRRNIAPARFRASRPSEQAVQLADTSWIRTRISELNFLPLRWPSARRNSDVYRTIILLVPLGMHRSEDLFEDLDM